MSDDEPTPLEPTPHEASPRVRGRRRVTVEAAPGTDPNPVAEPNRHARTENDDRLKAEKPPHY